MTDRTRELLFTGDKRALCALDYLGKARAERTRRELAAVDCTTCGDDSDMCPWRFKVERLPSDAGGQSQCLRWAREFGGISWRNPDGHVIIMPQEAVEALGNAIRT